MIPRALLVLVTLGAGCVPTAGKPSPEPADSQPEPTDSQPEPDSDTDDGGSILDTAPPLDSADSGDAVDADADGFDAAEDCDDGDAAVHPGATELCDEVDSDCDGLSDDVDATDTTTWYTDADGDGYGDAATALTACTAPADVVADGGDCADDDATCYPGAEEICGDGLINDCDATTTTECGFGATESLSGLGLELMGEDRPDEAGRSLAGLGDVDGDGRTDLLIGAPDEDTLGSNTGAAYLVLGATAAGWSGSASLGSADLQFTAEARGDNAGVSVTGPGDVDGDGYADLLIGASGNDDNGTSAGAAYLVSGTNATGATSPMSLGSADLEIMGGTSNVYAGLALGAAGDVDGDGLADLLLGLEYDNTAAVRAGAAVLLLGATAAGSSTDFDLAIADLVMTGEAFEDRAGAQVEGAGDVDGDGLDDLIVGASEADSTAEDAGTAYLVLGGSVSGVLGTISLGDADLRIDGTSTWAYTGADVAGAGDVDGDGSADLLVGSTQADTGAKDSGSVVVILGTTVATAGTEMSISASDMELYGKSTGALIGDVVAGVGDIDADGFDDVAIGAPNDDTAGAEAGAIYLVSGATLMSGRSPLSAASADTQFQGANSGDGAGNAVARGGDVNADGWNDLLIGASESSDGAPYAGAVWVAYGGGI